MLRPAIHTPHKELLARIVRQTGDYLVRKSRRFVHALPLRMENVILWWFGLFGLAAAIRIAASVTPIESLRDFAEIFLPYALAALAPVAGYRIALAAFPAHTVAPQPGFRLAVFGRWRNLGPIDSRAHPAFGPFGFMASLLVGMLLNIPVRSFEFLAAVPAMNSHAPEWGTAIFHMMAFDVIAMNFLYAVCFVMALRSIPLFPRMLLFAWCMDLFFQFAVARSVAGTPNLPDQVAVALQQLLDGNITKVLISAAIWLPYLLLSERVNVTYRARVAA